MAWSFNSFIRDRICNQLRALHTPREVVAHAWGRFSRLLRSRGEGDVFGAAVGGVDLEDEGASG